MFAICIYKSGTFGDNMFLKQPSDWIGIAMFSLKDEKINIYYDTHKIVEWEDDDNF